MHVGSPSTLRQVLFDQGGSLGLADLVAVTTSNVSPLVDYLLLLLEEGDIDFLGGTVAFGTQQLRELKEAVSSLTIIDPGNVEPNLSSRREFFSALLGKHSSLRDIRVQLTVKGIRRALSSGGGHVGI